MTIRRPSVSPGANFSELYIFNCKMKRLYLFHKAIMGLNEKKEGKVLKMVAGNQQVLNKCIFLMFYFSFLKEIISTACGY